MQQKVILFKTSTSMNKDTAVIPNRIDVEAELFSS